MECFTSDQGLAHELLGARFPRVVAHVGRHALLQNDAAVVRLEQERIECKYALERLLAVAAQI